MEALDQAFASSKSKIDAVYRIAEDTLRNYCSSRGFLLAGRDGPKQLSSILDKIETGRYSSFFDIDDVIAFSVVVDTSSQEKEVRSFLRSVFHVKSIKSKTSIQDERAFDFDCTRVYCQIIDKTGARKNIDAIVFEVQIRTILQHAWSKITHPHVYKASGFDPRKARLAAELMAQIESADRTFSRFSTSSRAVKSVVRQEVVACSGILKMLDRLESDGVIPSESRPLNGRRLAENIYKSIRGRKNNYEKAIVEIERFMRNEADPFPVSVSLYQLSIVALLQSGLLDENNKRYYYVTKELITIFPNVKKLKNVVSFKQ